MIDRVKTLVTKTGNRVTFRTPSASGCLVVEVWVNDKTNPRIMTYSEGPMGKEPTSLFWEEVKEYVKLAHEVLDIELSDFNK